MDWIHRLPIEIISHIIPYTYQPQNKKLLNDIKNYKETQEIFLNLYHAYWSDLYLDSEEYKHWLMNDILSYVNHYKAIIYGHVCYFYTIFKRNTRLKSIKSIDTYVNKFIFKNVNTQINLLLGLLNVHERDDLVDECYIRLAYDS